MVFLCYDDGTYCIGNPGEGEPGASPGGFSPGFQHVFALDALSCAIAVPGSAARAASPDAASMTIGRVYVCFRIGPLVVCR